MSACFVKCFVGFNTGRRERRGEQSTPQSTTAVVACRVRVLRVARVACVKAKKFLSWKELRRAPCVMRRLVRCRARVCLCACDRPPRSAVSRVVTPLIASQERLRPSPFAPVHFPQERERESARGLCVLVVFSAAQSNACARMRACVRACVRAWIHPSTRRGWASEPRHATPRVRARRMPPSPHPA